MCGFTEGLYRGVCLPESYGCVGLLKGYIEVYFWQLFYRLYHLRHASVS